jgi:hypothetical protein
MAALIIGGDRVAVLQQLSATPWLCHDPSLERPQKKRVPSPDSGRHQPGRHSHRPGQSRPGHENAASRQCNARAHRLQRQWRGTTERGDGEPQGLNRTPRHSSRFSMACLPCRPSAARMRCPPPCSPPAFRSPWPSHTDIGKASFGQRDRPASLPAIAADEEALARSVNVPAAAQGDLPQSGVRCTIGE